MPSCSRGNEEAPAADQREGTIRDIATVKWNTPDEEFNGLTRYLFAVNADDPEAAQSGICVVAPNKQWAHAFEQMLVRRGFTVSSLGFKRLAGDPRDTNRARALVAYTSLNLHGRPGRPVRLARVARLRQLPHLLRRLALPPGVVRRAQCRHSGRPGGGLLAARTAGEAGALPPRRAPGRAL